MSRRGTSSFSPVLVLVLVVAVAVAATMTVTRATRAATPPYLELRFTSRDFVQAACATPAALADAWGATTTTTTSTYPSVSTDAQACPFLNDVADGTLQPHADFETDAAFVSSGTPLGYVVPNTTAPVNVTRVADNAPYTFAITPITTPFLSFGDASGIPKPAFACSSSSSSDSSVPCGATLWGNRGTRSVSSSKSFAAWYQDDPRVNLRVGFTLRLTKTSSNATTTITTTNTAPYSFSSQAFYPLDAVPRCVANASTDYRVDCSNGGATWPASARPSSPRVPFSNCNPLEETANVTRTCTGTSSGGCRCTALPTPQLPHNWLFTNEVHAFFRHGPTGTFTFQGDDDMLVYVNGVKVIDLSGLHEPLRASVDLSDANVSRALGLEMGRVYALDVFHAERHSPGSTFRIETTFAASCNAEQAGDVVAVFPPTVSPPSSTTTWFASPPTALETGVLVSTPDASGALWLRKRLDVGVSGFVASITVEFDVLDSPEGFALVLHRDARFFHPSAAANNGNTIVPGATGGSLGVPRGLANAVVVAMDFCPDSLLSLAANATKRTCWSPPPSTSSRATAPRYQVSLLRGGEFHTRTPGTVRRRFADVWRPPASRRGLASNAKRRIKLDVVHYGTDPDWLDVFVDGDLYLRETGLDLTSGGALGGRDAFVGVTASSGAAGDGSLRVVDVRVSAVKPDATQTIVVSNTVIANDTATATVRIQTRDKCGRPSFVPFSPSMGTLLQAVSSAVGATPRLRDSRTGRTLQASRVTDATSWGVATLDVAFSADTTSAVGSFDVVDVGPISLPLTPVVTLTAPPPRRAAPAPTLPPTDAQLVSLPSVRVDVVPLASGLAAVVFALLLVAAFGVVAWRRRWRANKAFVPTGKLATYERDAVLVDDPLHTKLATELQAQLTEIAWWRAQADVSERQHEIVCRLRSDVAALRTEIAWLRERLDNEAMQVACV